MTQTTAARPAGAPAWLERGRALVEPALREAVERLDGHTRLVSAYHLGWCDEHGRPRHADSGKAVRPTLVLLAAAACGADDATGVPGGVAAELVHNFSLVHDDLMDRDAERRHRPTVWAVWGDATAVLVGDAMLSLAHEVLSDCRSPYARDAQAVLSRATRELIRGQVLDVAFETRDPVAEPVRLSECLDMAAGKTGALLGVSAELGAVLAGAPEATRSALRSYGEEVGLAFQLVDDLLGIWGSPARTGKPVYSDLRARKRTLPVAWSTENGGAAGRELTELLATPGDVDDALLRHGAELVERAGGRAWALAEAVRRTDTAVRALDGVDLAAGPRAGLGEIARYLLEREGMSR